MPREALNLTRLVILWLLSEGPLHGYRIKKILDDPALSFWFPVEYASIYSVLRTLVKSGYIEVVVVEQDGSRPQRTRYAMTRSGSRHFARLLERAWLDPPAVADPFQLALAARADVGEGRIPGLLAARADALHQRKAHLDSIARSAPAPEMVERQMALTTTELEWLEKMITTQGGDDDV